MPLLIPTRYATEIRRAWHRGGSAAYAAEPMYGNVEVFTATGRATCRDCGEKIKRGALALKVGYDFNGSGSWTACEIQIHALQCTISTREFAVSSGKSRDQNPCVTCSGAEERGDCQKCEALR